jgi:6-bladed beta-propeller protein
VTRSSWRVVALWLGLGAASLTAVIGRAIVPARVIAPTDTLTVTGTCSECEITLERVAILGGPGLPFEFGSNAQLALMSDGRYLTTPISAYEIAVFGADGKYERTVGRYGEGPSEFTDIRSIGVARGDIVYVLQGISQLTLLGPDLREIDRASPQTPAPAQGWAIMPNGEIAFVTVALGTETPADRVSVIALDGRLRTTFAQAPRAYRNRNEDYNETVGRLSPSLRYDGVWFAKWNRYALHLFVDGRATKTLVRHADWFESWQGPPAGMEGLTVPKRSTIEAIKERPDGLVTIVATVTDANWVQNRPEIARGRTGNHDIATGTLPRRLMWDSVVEVIDPETDELVGHARSDDYLRAPVGGDGTLLYAAREDDIGRYRLFVYRVVCAQDQPSR